MTQFDKSTSKQWADSPPGADPSQASVLSQWGLQEEQGDAAQHQEQQVRYKEHTWTHTHTRGAFVVKITFTCNLNSASNNAKLIFTQF